MRGVWATAQLAVALATFAWAYMLQLGTDIPFWPACTAAAGLFFLVAAILFAARHPDARVVGLFGLLFFVVATGLLPVAEYSSMPARKIFAILSALAVIGLSQGLLLLGASRRDPAPVDPNTGHHAA